MIIAPPLHRLIEAARDAVESTSPDLEAVRRHVPAAHDFVLEAKGMFAAMAPTAPLKGEGKVLVDEITDLFHRQDTALRSMEKDVAHGNVSLLRGDLLRFEDATQALVEALHKLEQLEQEAPRQSPLPAVDHFIRIGINVIDQMLPRSALLDRLPMLVNTVQNLRGDLERFRVLHHPSPELSQRYEDEVRKLEAGLGATVQFFEDDRLSTLVDALRLLKAGSVQIMRMLSAMDRVANRSRSFSGLLAVEEMWRALKALQDGRATDDLVRRVAVNLHSLGEFYASQVDMVASFPLLFLVRPEYDRMRESVEGLLQVAAPWFNALGQDPRAAARDLAALEPVRTAYEHTSGTLKKLTAALEDRGQALAGAAQLEELVDVLGRVVVGSVSAEYARDRIAHYVSLQQGLIEEIDRGGGGPSSHELRGMMQTQMAAVLGMSRYLDDGKEEHLREGFAMLRTLHPRLVEIHEETRAAVEAQRRLRERTVSCFRCGTSNPATNRYCSRCNAVMPMQSTGESIEYADITGGGESSGAGTPENLRKLQSLYAQAEGGGDLSSVVGALEKMHRKLLSVAADYDHRLGRRLEGSDATLAEYGRAFRDGLSRFLEGVEMMRGGAESGRIDLMATGLDVALAAGHELHEAQQEMQTALAPS